MSVAGRYEVSRSEMDPELYEWMTIPMLSVETLAAQIGNTASITPANTRFVATSWGNAKLPKTHYFTDIQAAIDSIEDAGPTKFYSVCIFTGDYYGHSSGSELATLVLKPYVSLSGVGNDRNAVAIRQNVIVRYEGAINPWIALSSLSFIGDTFAFESTVPPIPGSGLYDACFGATNVLFLFTRGSFKSIGTSYLRIIGCVFVDGYWSVNGRPDGMGRMVLGMEATSFLPSTVVADVPQSVPATLTLQDASIMWMQMGIVRLRKLILDRSVVVGTSNRLSIVDPANPTHSKLSLVRNSRLELHDCTLETAGTRGSFTVEASGVVTRATQLNQQPTMIADTMAYWDRDEYRFRADLYDESGEVRTVKLTGTTDPNLYDGHLVDLTSTEVPDVAPYSSSQSTWVECNIFPDPTQPIGMYAAQASVGATLSSNSVGPGSLLTYRASQSTNGSTLSMAIYQQIQPPQYP